MKYIVCIFFYNKVKISVIAIEQKITLQNKRN